MKKYNFVYETTFNNGLYYRGQHKTDVLNDDYFGSSKIVKDLVRNHPELNPQRQILKFCNTQEELNYWEKYYIGDLYKTDPNCLNQTNKCTVKDVWEDPYLRDKIIQAQTIAQNRPEVKQKISKNSKEMWQNEEFRDKRKQSLDTYWEDEAAHKRQSEVQKKRYQNSNDAQRHSEWAKEYYKTHEGNRKNKKCSEETKRKNSEQSKDRAWLSKQGEHSVFVKQDKFSYYLNLGYRFGRK